MNPETGLPVIPWPDHFWRVRENSPGYFYVQLRRKFKIFRLFETSELIREEILLRLDKETIIEDAFAILRKVEAHRGNHDLLGDYPPKSL